MSHATDIINLPPERREATSPGGGFLLVWASLDGWRTFQAQAEFYSIENAQRRMLWRQALPHRHGPRQALVSDEGRVLLTDEWINVPAEHAIMVLDPQGKTLAHYTFDQVIAALGVPVREVGDRAKTSAWITEGPTLSADGATAEIKAGGRILVVRLADGQLSRKD
ncbi:hypothetical protein [Methylomagnum sp.]